MPPPRLALPRVSACARWQLLRVLGEGACAVVYEAVDTARHKLVALKLYYSACGGPHAATAAADAEWEAYESLGAAGVEAESSDAGRSAGIPRAYAHGGCSASHAGPRAACSLHCPGLARTRMRMVARTRVHIAPCAWAAAPLPRHADMHPSPACRGANACRHAQAGKRQGQAAVRRGGGGSLPGNAAVGARPF